MKFDGEIRPWGKFKTLSMNKECTVKIITVAPLEQLSIQYHNDREEYWRVIEGECQILNTKELKKNYDDDWVILSSNEEVLISKKNIHSIKTPFDMSCKILEISFGKFDENDIVRIEDKYGRK